MRSDELGARGGGKQVLLALSRTRHSRLGLTARLQNYDQTERCSETLVKYGGRQPKTPALAAARLVSRQPLCLPRPCPLPQLCHSFAYEHCAMSPQQRILTNRASLSAGWLGRTAGKRMDGTGQQASLARKRCLKGARMNASLGRESTCVQKRKELCKGSICWSVPFWHPR